MTIKTILVPVSGQPEDEVLLESAIAVARASSSHINVLHAGMDPRQIAARQMGEGMGASQVEAVVTAANKAYDDTRAVVVNIFEDWRSRHEIAIADGVDFGAGAAEASVTTSWLEPKQDPAAAVAKLGRLADLVIVSRPKPSGQNENAVVEAALMETGRPVLMVPPGDRHPRMNCIAVAWNGSREAARAVSQAMPVLETADRVLVLSGVTYTAAETDVESIANTIARHGVKVETVKFSANGGNLAEKLQAEALRGGADMLVLGAYSHSRLRELILGGVTKDILATSHMPIMFSH
ncbi:MAG: universal stress protein [Proteobacteria bacterium]|nr:universal stress protein [Pseudomonadota bacterium]MDA1311216.1 universal stress protein [Pseudomonadota bacterium]